MPPRYAFRLEDLRVFQFLRASCHACGHKAIIPNAALLQGRPGYTRLMSLERQLRCQRCGARGKASLDVDCGLAIESGDGETWRGAGLEPCAAAAAGNATRVHGQWSGPAGVWFASWPTASVIRRHTASPL